MIHTRCPLGRRSQLSPLNALGLKIHGVPVLAVGLRHGFEGQAHPPGLLVNGDHFHVYGVALLHHLAGILHLASGGQLRQVHQAAVPLAQVHDGAHFHDRFNHALVNFVELWQRAVVDSRRSPFPWLAATCCEAIAVVVIARRASVAPAIPKSKVLTQHFCTLHRIAEN